MKLLEGFKVAILVTDGFEQVEMVKPREALRGAGAVALLVSNKQIVQGWHHTDKGDSFVVDVTLVNANPGAFDALLLPGGVMSMDTLRTLPEAVAFTKSFNQNQKTIAAICHGPWLLINAMAVHQKKVTSWPSLKMDLNNAGAIWIDQPVVCDGHIITSRKPEDLPVFNEALIAQLRDTLTARD